MLINFEELQKEKHISAQETLDFSDRKVDDALLQKVNSADVTVAAYIIEPKDVHITLDVKYNVNYLDARTLDPLNVNFEFNEESLFTTDLQRAQELDIDHFTDEIDIDELIWELILVSIPFNYSENSSSMTITEEEATENRPFANLFNK